MAWRLAYSLTQLRAQFDKIAPGRSKSHDGTIGDAAHASRSSDHNPWIKDGGYGIVTAIDITHDPKHGVDTHKIADFLREKRDPRIKYVISAGRIWSATQNPFQWRKYTGSNGHYQHMHVSVRSEKSFYDSKAVWTLPSAKEAAETVPPVAETVPDDSPAARPVLKQGSSGDDVKTVQGLLGLLPPDGIFGPSTTAAVRSFQRGVGIGVDGIVGPVTWDKLDKIEQTPDDANWQTDIVATVFGGTKDPNQSAYEKRMINNTELGCALPFRFEGPRPQVIATNNATGHMCIMPIVDVGPWNTKDPYWETKTRPQAETGTDTRGRKTNLAGIDLTQGAAKALGISGKGKVNWTFAKDHELEE